MHNLTHNFFDFSFSITKGTSDLMAEEGLVWVSLNQVVQTWEQDANGFAYPVREKIPLGYEKCGDEFIFDN